MSPIRDVEVPSGSMKLDAILKIANSPAFGRVLTLCVLYVAWTWVSDDRIKTENRAENRDKEILEARKETLSCNQATITLLTTVLSETSNTNKQMLKYLEKNDK